MPQTFSAKNKAGLIATKWAFWLALAIVVFAVFLFCVGVFPGSYEYYCAKKTGANCYDTEGFKPFKIGFWVLYLLIVNGDKFINAVSTAIMAAFAIFLWMTTREQAAISDQQTTILDHQTQWMKSDALERDRMEKAKLRARIRIVFDKNPVERKFTGDVWYEVSARALNIGSTTACNVRIFNRLELMSSGQRIQNVRVNYHIHSGAQTTLLIGEGARSDPFPPQWMQDDTFSICVPEADYPLIEERKFNKRLFCYGYVVYEDIFEDHWSQEFAYEIDLISGEIRRTGYGNDKEISLNNWDYKGELAKYENPIIP